MYPPSTPIVAHQPADASAIDSASNTRNCERRLSSGPPHARGIAIRNTPARCICSTVRSGSRGPCSISSDAARIFGASSRTASSVRVERSFLSATVNIDNGATSSAIFSMGFLSCAFQSVKNRFTKETANPVLARRPEQRQSKSENAQRKAQPGEIRHLARHLRSGGVEFRTRATGLQKCLGRPPLRLVVSGAASAQCASFYSRLLMYFCLVVDTPAAK